MCRQVRVQVQVSTSYRGGETTRQHDELATDCLGDEGSGGTESERGDPAQQVVRD